MMDRVILRTKSNLSFAGQICSNDLMENQAGILLKPNPKSEVKVWCPEEEIDCVIISNEKILKGDELKNEFGF